MNNAVVAKTAGWLQFAGQVLGQMVANGIPTNVVGWATLFGSLVTAVAVHAAARTDGTK